MKIAIVGGGPRGLSVLERIVEWSREEQVLQITMFDPNGPGGKVWRGTQSLSLMMNSVVCQVTLFTDETLSTKGPVAKGPNLYEWAKEYATAFITEKVTENQAFFLKECLQLGPNDHCTRAFYGLYQKWFYEYIQTRMTQQTSVTFFKDTVRAVKRKEEKFQVYTQSVEITADKVILALGHQENELSGKEQQFATYAREHRLYYSSPKNAADSHLDAIKPQAPVIIRGLGLSFFDYVTLLTSGRGGYFEETARGLLYHASGEEPQIIAGSTRGFPYHSRGKNQKKYGEEHQPKFLKMKRLKKLMRKNLLSGKRFFELLKKEVELVYYTALVKENYPQINQEAFLTEMVKGKSFEAVLKKYKLAEKDLWDWEFLEHPEVRLIEGNSFSDYLMDYLAWDLQEAKKGNLEGPFSSAIDSLKDLRDEVHFMLDNDLFERKEDREQLWKWFTPLNSFLSIGPPLERIAELKALLTAGIVTIMEPKMKVEGKDGYFLATSENTTDQRYKAHFLIEARVHSTNNRLSLNPLTQQLIRDGLATLHYWQKEEDEEQPILSGALAIDYQTNQLVNKEGQVLSGLFCYGIPLEGVRWLTATSSRPGTNPWNLRESDEIASLIFDNKKG